MNKKRLVGLGLGSVIIAATVLGLFGAAPMQKVSAAPNAKAWATKGNKIGNKAFLGSTNNKALVFKTNNVERMRVEKDGKVGIGTASPVSKLNIVSAAGDSPPRLASSGTSSFGAGWDFYHGATGKGYVGVPDSAAVIGPGEMLVYGTGGIKTSLWAGGQRSVTIDTNGRVGIGTTAPADALDIASGALRLSNPGGLGDIWFTESADLIAHTTTDNPDPNGEAFRMHAGTSLTRVFTVRNDGVAQLGALADPAATPVCINNDLMLANCSASAANIPSYGDNAAAQVAKLQQENDALREQLLKIETRLAALEVSTTPNARVAAAVR